MWKRKRRGKGFLDGFFLETVNAVVLRRMMKRNEKDGEYHEVADSHYLCIDRIKYFRGGTVSDANGLCAGFSRRGGSHILLSDFR